ncbi:MotA/TolQ/ExbB proton channel family protein [Tritonibacter mobilis]|uniref:MotA/TolQ/ExbB proton channel family protein n=1 Tax=Tritonibacter mobilis TaxID=379347 RepID=UPI001CD9498A|nr:MotA/TolQ/ExbB proton channel family protein [Tritonibacter mobilis]MCA2005973.1 MotA/TolQ/ExbB proton channel family protein [Tritonibacter mobilis]
MSNFRADMFDPLTLVVFAALGVMSLTVLSVFIFKLLQFSRLGVGKRQIAEQIINTWLSGQAETAMQQAAARKSVLSRILHAVFTGLRARPGETAYAEELGRQTAISELATLSDRIRLLEIAVHAAPMLGLLGTVIGMIDAFSVLAQTQAAADPAALAGGIWTALTTTAAGLAVALVAYFLTSWLDARIERERNLIEVLISAAIHGRVDQSARQQG